MCLSLPVLRALISRPKNIKVEYQTQTGKKVQKEYKDFIARIFLHEYDHLEGLVFLDRVENNQDIIMEKEYQKLLKREKKKT